MWKPEYAKRRREKYQNDPSERERRKSQCRTPEENKEYMAEYYRNNPDKFTNTNPELRNLKRREYYKRNPEYREKCKSKSLEYSKKNPHKRIERIINSYGISVEQYNSI